LGRWLSLHEVIMIFQLTTYAVIALIVGIIALVVMFNYYNPN